MKHKLSTDAALPGGELKKGEAKKRKSPLTPYREKAKGKETIPDYLRNRDSKPARAREAKLALHMLVRGGWGRIRLFPQQRMESDEDETIHFLQNPKKCESAFDPRKYWAKTTSEKKCEVKKVDSMAFGRTIGEERCTIPPNLRGFDL